MPTELLTIQRSVDCLARIGPWLLAVRDGAGRLASGGWSLREREALSPPRMRPPATLLPSVATHTEIP